MGSAVSAGDCNDDLIDNLIGEKYIRTSAVERAFRAVDRAEYFIPDNRINAYKDLAWKSENLHLSAPCIYATVMEGLCLEPGLSFLNLGSGTGYLNTVAGIILGSYGTNHGVEIYGDVVRYANKKLADFKKLSGAMDEHDFCEPKFIEGNCLCLSSECRLYDRVYCGAGCPQEHGQYMKNLLKVGGILVVPLGDQLLQFKRSSMNSWESKSLLNVAFTSLLPIRGKKEDIINMPEGEPLSLQAQARVAIRNILRKNIELDLPVQAHKPKTTRPPKKKMVLRKLIVPLFDTDSSDEGNRLVFGDGQRLRGVLERSLAANANMYFEEANSDDEMACYEGVSAQSSDEPQSESKASETDEQGTSTGNLNGPQDEPCTSSCDVQAKKTNREKFDSGIGDENDIIPVSSPASDSDDEEEKLPRSSSSSPEIAELKGYKRISPPRNDLHDVPKWRRVDLRSLREMESSSDDESLNARREALVADVTRVYNSRFTEPMKAKIQELPVPLVLKNYLNFYREF